MPEPEWEFARPPPIHDPFGVLLPPRPTPKVHLLSSYTDDACGLISPKADDVIELPVLSPNGHTEPSYKVLISRMVHKELEKIYMIEDDPVHEKRRYLAWFGIDLTDFGAIDTPERFFQLLETALATEKIIVQDIVPLEGPPFPSRAVWMSMYGYFGNWYKPEERKWALRAGKRHTRLLRKLWERGDMQLVNERVDVDEDMPSLPSPTIVTCKHIFYNRRTWKIRSYVFPELLKEKFKLTEEGKEKEKEKEKRVHGCAHA
ncbi:hypothetical protein N7465_006481 [Penicillium sp. CMV-2018d]|nr:hypothetical protein N7465_006481 [Penicillium sp. CMV-2018d]